MENQASLPDNIVFFDGHCNLCSRSVQLILKNDRKEIFSFAPLQSNFAMEYLDGMTSGTNPESVVLASKGRIYRESEAALRIAAGLRWPYAWLSVFLWVPAFMRDPLYRLIARRRYRWFGRTPLCFVPKENWKSRFIG
jgi:predicted DCC family thiol-disulfide oxidoreductase YuxK